MHSVCFHHVDAEPKSEFDVTPEDLRRFVKTVLDSGAVFISPSAVVDAAIAPGTSSGDEAVCLIFDDGYRSALEHVAPLMADLGLAFGLAPATALLIDGERPSAMPHSSRDFLGMDDLRLWRQAGGELLGHSHSHIALDALGTSTLEHELDTELAAYDEHGVPRPDVFVYPFGAHDRRARSAVAARYRAAFATGSGAPAGPDSRFHIHRVTFRTRKVPRLLRLDWRTLESGSDD